MECSELLVQWADVHISIKTKVKVHVKDEDLIKDLIFNLDAVSRAVAERRRSAEATNLGVGTWEISCISEATSKESFHAHIAPSASAGVRS